MSRDWYVNQPGASSPKYTNKAQAKKVAKNLRGAKVSRKPRQGGDHTTSRGSEGCAVTGIAAAGVAVYEFGKAWM